MYVQFWGTRGSIAKAGPTTLRYGGNTTCVEVRSDGGTLLVIDCGTGAHGLGAELTARADGAPIVGNILITHTHWDHIQGLPFFEPLFQPANEWRVYGPKGLGDTLAETLSGQMQYSYFPVSIDQLGGVVDYHDLVEGVFEIDDIRITTHYLNHPALTLGYRIEADGATFVYSSDHEPHHPDLAGGGDVGSHHNDRLHAEFARDADLLVHDTQYLAAEYPQKIGWGHSTAEYVVDVARYAGVHRLALSHHDPSRTDDQVDELVLQARAHAARGGFTGEVFAAAEGMRIELRGAGRSRAEHPSAKPANRSLSLDSISRSLLMAVEDAEIAATLRTVGEAEGFSVTAASRDELVEVARESEPAMLVVEPADNAELRELGARIREIELPDGEAITLVAIRNDDVDPEAARRAGVTDWLAWPSSATYIRTKLRAWMLRRACRWEPAPIPPDERRRLRSLRELEVLDTEPEERFDRLTAQASNALDVPIALVSLVDEDRQWFKSRIGIEATETPRDVSFCAHAIASDEVFQVPDALHDPRFADNPVVAGDPRLRFYAGVPLTLSDGTRAGTLCVVDYRPRVLDADELDVLRRLGAQVASELEAG